MAFRGRGAQSSNVPIRFGLATREADGDCLDAPEDIDGPWPKLHTTAIEERGHSIFSFNRSPGIPCEFAAALSLLNVDEFFDQNRASAIAKVSLRTLLSTYATIEPDAKFPPHWFSLVPVGHSPGLRVKLLAALPEAFDGSSILDVNELSIFRSATIEPTAFEIRKPIANQELPLTVSHTLMHDTGSGLRNGCCHREREDRPHVDSLSVPSTGAMVFAL